MNALIADVLAFFLITFFGLSFRKLPLILFVWTAPFAALNLIFGLDPLYTPYRAAAFSCIALAAMRSNCFQTLRGFGRQVLVVAFTESMPLPLPAV